MNVGFEIIEREISGKINDELKRAGILYRLFSRTKSDESIQEKTIRKSIEGNPYQKNVKLIQDIIGIRVVTYFIDDVDIVLEILKKCFIFINQEIDEHGLTIFKPKRTNIVCAFNDKQTQTLNEIKLSAGKAFYELLDNTFELQLRTILSEGWHEIDHNLRYKCKQDWIEHFESERMLNGVYAGLETNDIVLKNLFNELAYKHFKSKNWEGFMRNKFRLKFGNSTLRPELITRLNEENSLAKKMMKLDRQDFLLEIHNLKFSIPLNMNNFIYLINALQLKDEEITALTPQPVKEYFIE